ncbi:MAG: metallophosphoesterase [Candidatus Kariarchaeaceae archaeon]
MRIIAFSDWHIQSVEQLFKWLESFKKPIDLIIYAGDGVSQFYESSYPEWFISDLTNGFNSKVFSISDWNHQSTSLYYDYFCHTQKGSN